LISSVNVAVRDVQSQLVYKIIVTLPSECVSHSELVLGM
jgi:hypothetical protein